MNKIKIAGVVVLFHPKMDELNQNIYSYIEYVDVLFVVVNSKFDKYLLVSDPKIEIVDNVHNLGIAKALNQASELAVARGYNWLLTMDQDSSFFNDRFFEAFNLSDKSNVAIFSPNHDIKRIMESGDLYKFENSDLVMTSGNIINLNMWQEVGGFEEKLFIDDVDIDYCLKVRTANARIITFKNIFLNHNLGKLKVVYIVSFKFCLFQHVPIRTYYIFRNNLYTFVKHFRKHPVVIVRRIVELIKEFVRILLFQENRKQHLKYMFFGVRDFIIGKYGSIEIVES